MKSNIGERFVKKIEKSLSLADKAYSMIKQAIISGELLPNETLPEEKLAADLGISRTPLREALKKLSHEGLLIFEKGKPAFVATFTKKDALDFMEVRRLLEVYSIQQIVPKIDDRLLKELEDNLRQQIDAINSKDYPLFIDLDRTFHLLLANQNSNKKLIDMIHNANTGVNRAFLVLSSTLAMSAKEAYKEHCLILEALKKRDVELAKQCMEEHMKNIESRFLKYYKEESK
jgi:DNA-binding GntR family transcriptional regulator